MVSVDTNGNGTYEPAEQIPPTNTSGTGTPDTTPPSISLTLATSGNEIVISLAAVDNVTPNPLIRYSIENSPVQTYAAPLVVAAGENVVLKAYSKDAMGNTSGLVTTNVRPSLAATKQGGPSIGLSWPVAEAYLLEEADSVTGPWTVSTATISRNTFNEFTTIPIGTIQKKFYRLRSQAVTK